MVCTNWAALLLLLLLFTPPSWTHPQLAVFAVIRTLGKTQQRLVNSAFISASHCGLELPFLIWRKENETAALSAPLNAARPTLIFWPSSFITFTPVYWLWFLQCSRAATELLLFPSLAGRASKQPLDPKVSICLPEHKFCKVIFNSWQTEDVFRSTRKNSLFQSLLGYPVTLSS